VRSPCTFDSTWCTVLDIFRGPATDAGPDTQLPGELSLKAFGVMGLRAYDGTFKPDVRPDGSRRGALPGNLEGRRAPLEPLQFCREHGPSLISASRVALPERMRHNTSQALYTS